MPSSVFMEKFFLHSYSLRPSGGEQPRAQSRTELPPPGKSCPVQRTRGAQQRKRHFLTAQTQCFGMGAALDAQPGPPPASREQSELSCVLRSQRADGAELNPLPFLTPGVPGRRKSRDTYGPYLVVVLTLAAQWCPILRDAIDCSPPGSSVHGILQARLLEWVAMPFSRGSSGPRDRTWVS